MNLVWKKLSYAVMSAIFLISFSSCSGGAAQPGANPSPADAAVSETAPEIETESAAPSDSSPSQEASVAASESETASGAATEDYHKYPNPVTVTMATAVPTLLPTGEDINTNKIQPILQQYLNININYTYVVQQNQNYDEKMNVLIASGNLPDIMLINSLSQVQELVKANQLADLTQVYDQYSTPNFKQVFDSWGSQGWTSATYNGNKMAIPSLGLLGQHMFTWVRTDWLDKVGGQMPSTYDDLVNLANEFIEKDPGGNGAGKTIGMEFDCELNLGGAYNTPLAPDPLFNSFNSFTGSWYYDNYNNLQYGSVAPETKTALTALSGLYQQGILAKDFAIKKQADIVADINAGKCGITFGPWWTIYWPLNDAYTNDQNARWAPCLCPLDADGSYMASPGNPHTQWVVVSKNCKNPEAAVILASFSYDACLHLIPEIEALQAQTNQGYDWALFGCPIQFAADIPIVKSVDIAWNAIDKKDVSLVKDTNNDAFWVLRAQGAIDYLNGNVNASSVQEYSNCLGEKVAADPKTSFFNQVFPAPTKTMNLKWANLQKLELQDMLAIIMGNQPPDYFDTFVNDWKNQGGAQITDEVTAELASMQ